MIGYSIKDLPNNWSFPSTRYQGSKRKIVSWIYHHIKELEFESALDLFGGTGIVSFLLKRMGKEVTYNDFLYYNFITAKALLINSFTSLTDDDVNFILHNNKSSAKYFFISKTFKGFYFLDHENSWLDRTIENINNLKSIYKGKVLHAKKAVAIWALGQACLIKRPFNLFHRRNLNLRTNEVNRKFGNKTTWEKPFPIAFVHFVNEANKTIFDNGRNHKALCMDAFNVNQNGYDLVYLDPPYFHPNQRETDYREMYHFLEGLSKYEKWPDLIDYNSFNLRLKREHMIWPTRSKEKLIKLYKKLFNKFNNSIIVISHKSNSYIPVLTMKKMLLESGKSVKMHRKRYYYALNKRNGKPRENIEWLYIAI